MRVDLFDYCLPPERIALEPASPARGRRACSSSAPTARSSIGASGIFRTSCGPATRSSSTTRASSPPVSTECARGATAVAKIEAMLIKRIDESRWRALVRPAKKLKVGERIRFGEASESQACLLGSLDAEVEAKGEAGEIVLNFAFSGAALDEAIERIGLTPLPPYIAARRPAAPEDRKAYQTIFADEPGAVAAPTAGLHFTPALLARIEAAGASLHRVTLHVGAGTFLPVKAADTRDHVMHSEWGRLDAATAQALNAARARGGRIVAIGTTSLRLLESAADASGDIRAFEGETAIFITPGHAFRAVDVLFTNFHLPRSTLLMLVSAFSGPATVRAAYAHAISAGYRFYSYGDACLLHRAPSSAHPREAP